MRVEQYTVQQNTGYVEQAQSTTAPAVLDDIERRAMASVATAKVETSRADEAQQKSMGSSPPAGGSAEANLYGNLLMAAVETVVPGIKSASDIMGVVGTRMSDHKEDREHNKEDHSARLTPSTEKSGVTAASSSPARTMGSEISDMMRKPGLHRVQQNGHVIGGGASASAPTSAKDNGIGLIERTNIARSSLNDQGPAALKSWAVRDAHIGSVAEARKATFSLEMSSVKAYESVQEVRRTQSVAMGMMAPGMGMRGPKAPSQSIMNEPKERDEAA